MNDRKSAQQAHAERALEMASGIEPAPRSDNTPTANEGIISTPRADYPPSGAFYAEGHEPALRRSGER